MKSIKDILSQYNEIDERYIRISMDLASQISAYLKEKKWSQAKFAMELKKNESEVSKWLSGTHNFTVKTLALIESVLKKDLFVIPLDINKNSKPKEKIVVKFAPVFINFNDMPNIPLEDEGIHLYSYYNGEYKLNYKSN